MQKRLDFEAWQGIATLFSYLLFATTFAEKYMGISAYILITFEVFSIVFCGYKMIQEKRK